MVQHEMLMFHDYETGNQNLFGSDFILFRIDFL